jgi:hypothetical protein
VITMAKTFSSISFKAKINRPSGADKGAPWMFLHLPQDASDKLPSRGMVAVEGLINGAPFLAVVEPDGQGGHWLKMEQKLQEAAKAKAGEVAELEIAPTKKDLEPDVPEDFQAALHGAPQKAKDTWAATTSAARRDWIAWIVSGKKAETRVKRIEVAMSKMSAGSKRPCCFDKSGIYSKEFSAPIPEEE